MTPEQLVTQLAEYFSIQSDVILESGGTVDKYIGDAIMAFWNAPQTFPQHALAACTAALCNQQKLRVMHEKWQAEGKPLFLTRIGLCTGEVIVGNIGSTARLNYTVIGDPVNMASRVEGLNKFYNTRVLINDTTYVQAQPAIVARPLDWVSVKGKTIGVLIHELLGLKGQTTQAQDDLAAIYAQALTRYRSQDWGAAIELFQQVLRREPLDLPAQQMIERCRGYQQASPGPTWDGVHRMATK